jgi:hypothetical protein
MRITAPPDATGRIRHFLDLPGIPAPCSRAETNVNGSGRFIREASVILRHPRRLSRRRFVSLASAAGVSLARPVQGSARLTDITNATRYFAQGQTGGDSMNNCGPATVATAIAYSGVASPSVEEVRNALGFYGPTSTDQWANLLNLYNVPWRATWSKGEIDAALQTGHVVIIAAWMDDLSSATDFEKARSPDLGQAGRYDGFRYGHSMLIVGTSDERRNYQIHDPNVFEMVDVDWYSNGSPKGAYRRYNADEVWNTVNTYAGGFGIAVSRPASSSTASTPAVVQIESNTGDSVDGPAGGQPAQRNFAPSANLNQIPRILTNTLTPSSKRATSGSADVK